MTSDLDLQDASGSPSASSLEKNRLKPGCLHSLCLLHRTWQDFLHSLAPIGYEDDAGFHYGEEQK